MLRRGSARIDSEGIVPSFESVETESKEALRNYFRRENGGKIIEALWAPESDPGYSWVYKTDIPHESFEVVEDGEPYCRRIVFSLADAK